jgi:site-specific recombinase XerD
MEKTVYRRHVSGCLHSGDRYSSRCRCPEWIEFTWPSSNTSFDGRKLNRGQNRWSLKTRSNKEAQKWADKLMNELEDLLQGKPVRPTDKGVEDAVNDWLEFRSKNGLTTVKAKLMGDKLINWCNDNDVLLLTALTSEYAVKFRMSLPFRTSDSNSLSVHLSVIGGFFNWCEGMGYIAKNPMPNGKQNPQFAVRFEKKEVIPPTRAEVERVLNMATGRLGLLAALMRETGMALIDALAFEPLRLEEDNLIRGNRTKTRERYRVRISTSLADQLRTLGSPAFPGTYSAWRERLNKLFRDAGVKMTPHGFRHLRISESLAHGTSVADVSKMVGTSEKEIRKTYEHWVKEAEDRLDEVQRKEWLAQGLDEFGNKVTR